MENTELLHAIGQMMEAQEKRTDEKFTILREEMATKDEINGLREEMSENNASLREEMAELRENMDEQFTRLRKVANNADMKADKFFQRIQNLLEEGYAPVADAAWSVEEKVADYEEVKSRQADHERAIQQHNERLIVLEEKAY